MQNKQRYITVLSILIGVQIVYTGCTRNTVSETTTNDSPTETEATAQVSALPTDTAVYVSLGDSIARGYGLVSPQDERYSTVAAGLLEQSGKTMTVFNYGVDGQTSSELLSALNDGMVPMDILSEADLCTISIGANNILGPGMTFLYDYYQYLYSEPSPFDDAGIAEQYKYFTEQCAEGIEQLQDDIPQIISAIKQVSPHCELYFLTLYNPYEHSPVVLYINGMPIQLSTLSDTYCRLVNQCIEAASDEGTSYKVIDVYTAFSGTDGAYVNVTNPPALSETDIDMGSMDPHPNKAGHARIAGLIADAIQ